MIRREDRGNVAVLTMEHGKANALDRELCTELEHRFREIGEDECRALVLTGTGKVFSAGVDLKRLVTEGDPYLDRFLPALERVVRSLFVLPKPVVAAINGHAIAGGCLLAQCADHRIVAQGSARMGTAELLVGVPFPTVGLEVLRFQAGSRNAQRLAYTGAQFGPDDAVALGLADRSAPAGDLLETCIGIAEDLAKIPTATFALTKRQLRRPVLEVIDRDALAFDAEVRELWSAPDVRAAVEDYVQRVLGGGRDPKKP